jgi:Tfp pilus tip-associated adhesin PilY1
VTTTNVPVATCTAAAASAGNSWTTTTCPAPVTTTNVAVAACTPATANAGNSYTTTTCSVQTVSGPTAVANCTPIAPTAGNGYQNTSCAVIVNSTPVQTCTPIAASAGNNWTATTCGVNTTTAVPVATCTAAAASAGNSWTTTTCPAPIVTTAVPVATCTAAAANAGNSYTTTTCPAPVTTTNVPVATCTAAAAGAGNSWTTTTCNPLSNLNVPVATCTAVAASAGNNWTATTCPAPIVTTAVPVATCTAATASAGNSWTTTTCPAPNVTTNIPVASCTAAAASSTNSYTTTTCPAAIITTNVPVATCSAQTAAAGNNYVRITCPAPIVTTNVPVASCTAAAASALNTWTTTTCSPNNLTNTPVATCTAATASAGNNWTTTTCPAPVVTTSVPVATCTAAAASAGNNWTATTCPAPIVTSNVPVQTCTATAEAVGNNWTTTTCSNNSTSNVPVQTCTASLANAGNNWTETTCSPNNAVNVPTQNCTASVASAANNWVGTSCTPNNSSNVPVATCTGATGSVANNWTTTTCTPIVSAPVFNNTCTAAAAVGPNFIATVCTPVTGDVMKYQTTTTTTETLLSGGVVVPGVTPVVTTTTDVAVDHNSVCYLAGTPTGAAPPLPTPNPQAPGLDISPWSPAVAGPSLPGGCSAWPCSVDQTNVGGSINSLADVAQYYYVTDLRPAADWPATIATDNVPSIGGGPEDDKATWQHMTTFTIALGVSGTLNYRSDYRSSSIVTGDFAGIRSGIKNWPLWPDPTKSIPAGAGNLAWDSTTQSFNDKNYWNDARSIDDFWHAAVNGRGQYFSAGTPTAVVTGLTGALAGIQSRLSSGAAAGVSNIQPIAGDNFIYVGNYTTSKWTGEVQAREIDVTTGAPSATALWSAQAKLDALTNNACDNRNIYLIRDGATNNMVNFSWNSSTCASDGSPTGVVTTGLNASEQAQFNSTKVGLLSQFTTMTDGSNGTVDQKTPAAGENLLNYLRGQRGKEGFESNDANKLYRARDHVLGDIVNGQPVYVKAPFAAYVDRDYDTFKLAQQNRTPMVYVPANDGMLHALYANVYQPFPNGTLLDPLGGAEAWAIVPSAVLPNLYKLADNNYANTHTYSVDGTPIIADIDAAGPPPADPTDPYTSDWKTILVAGLNAGGKGYYAIDVTTPATPKVLWEFKWSSSCWNGVTTNTKTDCHIGYTFGKPVITKLADGRWVVMFTSGYNNINSPVQTGDGLGYLYVVNANTGALIYKIATTAGDSTTPSGLAQINNYVDNGTTDNRTTRVYGADELGNIWRFDVNDQIAPLDIDDGPGNGREAVLLGTAMDSNGVGQPITTRPELAELNGQTRVYVGTGRLLGPSDLDAAQARSTQQQSVYGFIDPVTPPNAALPLNPIYSDLRGALRPLTMTQVGTGSTATRTVACSGNAADCTRPAGWVVDLPDSGERVNVDLKLVFGTLTFASNVPQSNACSIGGYSWFNFLNYSTGLAVSRSPNLSISQYVSNSLVVGMNALLIPPSSSGGGGGGGSGGSGVGGGLGTPGMILCTSDGNCIKIDPPIDTAPPAGKRISWREVVNTQ